MKTKDEAKVEYVSTASMNAIKYFEEIFGEKPELLIRCRDCKFFTKSGRYCFCEYWSSGGIHEPTQEDGHCHHGVRR